MRIHINQAVPGCVLLKDIYAVNETPVVKKQTALTEQLVHIIKQFLVEYIEVKPVLVNGETFTPDEKIKMEIERSQSSVFEDMYDTTVETYEKMWRAWGAGSPIDMKKMRTFIIPLLEDLEGNAAYIFTAYQFNEREKYAIHHAVSVALLAALLAKKYGCSQKEWLGAAIAGLLCDASLTKVSWPYGHTPSGEEDRKHPIQSYHMAKATGLVSDEVLLAILQHHEREDGSGYPLGMKNGKIYILSSLVAAADMYYAMASERLEEGKSAFHIMREITVQSSGKLPPAVVETLTGQFVTVMTGRKVQLVDGRTASIVHLDRREIEYPLVQLEEDGQVVQLNEKSAIHHVV